MTNNSTEINPGRYSARSSREIREALLGAGIAYHLSAKSGIVTALSVDHGENVRFALMLSNIDAVVIEIDQDGDPGDIRSRFNVQILPA